MALTIHGEAVLPSDPELWLDGAEEHLEAPCSQSSGRCEFNAGWGAVSGGALFCLADLVSSSSMDVGDRGASRDRYRLRALSEIAAAGVALEQPTPCLEEEELEKTPPIFPSSGQEVPPPCDELMSEGVLKSREHACEGLRPRRSLTSSMQAAMQGALSSMGILVPDAIPERRSTLEVLRELGIHVSEID
uniref:Uncharacterized protein n=1 Tax=Haptolina ericina TaxID=156174 RepID=A0A7S3AQP1_9EUKA